MTTAHTHYDVVVIGLGIMGASALYHLSRQGIRVLGLDSLGPVHHRGSSHGQTRIFRKAYWEGESFVPFLNRSHTGWLELHDRSHDPIMLPTGGLFIGQPNSRLIRGSRDTAQQCGIDHEYLLGQEISQRFPAFNVTDENVGLYEPGAFMIFAEQARLAYLSAAVEHSAHISYGNSVRGITASSGNTVRIETDGSPISTGAAVLTVGAWVGQFLTEELGPRVTPMRVPVFELDVDEPAAEFFPGQLPVFLYEQPDDALIYGLPKWRTSDGGLRVGFHNRQLQPLDPSADRTAPAAAELHALWAGINPLLPAVRNSGRATACIYTVSADEGFYIGRSQALPGVAYASACSGHGFKFAPAIGQALCDLALDGHSTADLTPFSLDRARPHTGSRGRG